MTDSGAGARSGRESTEEMNRVDYHFTSYYNINYYTSNNHRLENAGLNALEELLRCWECTEKIVNPACVF